MGYLSDGQHLQDGVALVRVSQVNVNQLLKATSHGHHKCVKPIRIYNFQQWAGFFRWLISDFYKEPNFLERAILYLPGKGPSGQEPKDQGFQIPRRCLEPQAIQTERPKGRFCFSSSSTYGACICISYDSPHSPLAFPPCPAGYFTFPAQQPHHASTVLDQIHACTSLPRSWEKYTVFWSVFNLFAMCPIESISTRDYGIHFTWN